MKFRPLALVLGFVLALTACRDVVRAATVSAVGNGPTWTALKNAAPGDVVQASGLTGTLDLSGINQPAPGVTLAPSGTPAALDRIIVNNGQGLNIAGFTVAGTASWMADVYAINCARINFDKMAVHSADGTISGSGFVLRSCTDASVTNSIIDHVGQGGALIDSDRILIQGNSFSNIESDGLDISNTGHARVIGNHFTDFFPAVGDHPDGIQFFAAGIAPASYPTGSLIEDNVILRGKGLGADGTPFPEQGIFIESQDHITIHRNAISCSLYNAISLSTVNTALVDGNFISGCADFGGRIITRGTSDHVTVSNNSAPGLPITYSTATEPPPTNYVDGGGNKVIPFVAVPAPGVAPDTTALDAWVAANIGGVTPPPPVCPVDPQIAVLKAQVAALTLQVTTLQAQNTKLTTTVANDTAAFNAIRAALPR